MGIRCVMGLWMGLVVIGMAPAHAQQPPAPLYAVTLSIQATLTGKQAADLVNALANSEVAAMIAVPMINGVSGQIQAQNEAREVAARQKVDDIARAVRAENDAKKAAEEAAAAAAAKAADAE